MDIEIEVIISVRKVFILTTPGSGLTNAQAADAALTAEIATYITDVATRLQNADSDAEVQQIATDMLADASTLQTADTALNAPPAAPPAGGSVPPSEAV